MVNKFKNSNQQLKTRGLFWETTQDDKSACVYTLKNEPHLGLPSLYQAYMLSDDPTEYRFATAYLDGWDHWKSLSRASWFQEYILAWRDELQTRIQSQAIQKIRDIAAGTGRDSLSAAKTLVDLGGGTAKRSKAGRPTKDTSEEDRAQQALERRLVAEDLFRLQKDIN